MARRPHSRRVSYAPPTATLVIQAVCRGWTSPQNKSERFPCISAVYEKRADLEANACSAAQFFAGEAVSLMASSI